MSSQIARVQDIEYRLVDLEQRVNELEHRFDKSTEKTVFHSVVLVGAGFSGLYAARLLRKQFPDLLIVEAQDRIGGRVKPLEGLVSWPVQEGPEFIHGFNAVLKDLVDEMGCKLREYSWPDYWYVGSEDRLFDCNTKDEEIDRMHNLFARIGKEEYPMEDMSAEDWLRSQGATNKMIAAADACYANDWGCSVHQLGLRELITEARRTDASHARINGEPYVLLDRSLHEVIKHIAKDLTGKIRLSWPVEAIEYSEAGAVVYGPGGARIKCAHVVVTAPISVLGSGGIRFLPALPRRKQMAMQRVQMCNAIKVMCVFSKPFWPEDFFDIICTDCFIPEFWVTKYPPTSEKHRDLHLMTGFMAGAAADAASKLSEKAIISKTLAQLDKIFGTEGDIKPATDRFVRAKVVDWSQNKYVRGCYAHPSLGAHVGDREALAAPVAGTLFFAGEATHPAVNPCIQFALQTGEHAAAQLIDAAFPSRMSRI